MAGRLTPAMLDAVAERFRVLGEPARLALLQALRDGERSVGDLVGATGLGQANVSKHLQVLHAAGYVARRRDGLFAYYGLADRAVLRLCELMCGRVEATERARLKAIVGR
jgi:DNA-binding transcriptional ArsR family regulator